MRISPIKMYNNTQYNNSNNTATNVAKDLNTKYTTSNMSPSFQGKLGNFVDKIFGQKYAAYLYKQPWFDKLAGRLANSKMPGFLKDTTANMATIGALLTSGTYVARTVNNKDLDPDKRRTLTVNQIINFIVPTVFAYTISHEINDWVDTKRKIYSANYTRRANLGLEMGHMTQAEYDAFMARKNIRVGSVKALATLVTFTLIYRFIAPVAMTPIANKIGEKLNNKKAAKAALAAQANQEQQSQAENKPTLA